MGRVLGVELGADAAHLARDLLDASDFDRDWQIEGLVELKLHLERLTHFEGEALVLTFGVQVETNAQVTDVMDWKAMVGAFFGNDAEHGERIEDGTPA
jgi:hypothetical protein